MSERTIPPIPKVAPEDWGHDLAIFRESFLCYLTDPEHNEAFRAFGKAQFEILLEAAYLLPYSNLDDTAYRLQAALADLRHLQGFLAFTAERSEAGRGVDRDQHDGDEEAVKKHEALCRLGNRLSKKLGAVADELEKAVADWQFE